MEWLVIWGVAKAAGLLAKPILEDFAKDTGKDFAKDFFKDGLKKVIHLPEPNILKEAYGKALKEFLQLMEQELVNANCRSEQIREYIEPLKQFATREDVAAVLGSAFELNCKSIDTRILYQAWAEITAPSLPEDFDWELVSKLYVRAIKKIINESEKLRSIHAIQAQISTAESIGNLAGIAPEFNLRTYAEGLQEQYGTVKLESLDTTGVYYSELKLWKIFVPQNVRECQEFLPQVYELPKEHERRLRDKGQLDEAEIAEAELERRNQAYRSQINRSILEIVAGNSPVQKVVILGDPGAGKSSLLQYLALIWAELPIRDLVVPPTPLLVELRTYARDRQAGKCKDILTFLHGGNITCRLDRLQLHDKLKAGHAIALFDGIDEVFDPALRDEVVTDIHRFTNDYPQVRVIATSRWLGYKVQRLLRKVAHHMQSSAKGLAGNIISAMDLENILTEYLRGIIEKGEPRMVARQMIYQLRHRNFILCYLGADSYAFVHRTFLEYFCAWEFVWQFKETQTLTVERLKNEVFAPHWQDESWHEVLRLISGMIDAKAFYLGCKMLLKMEKVGLLDKQQSWLW
jgi:predicted NACHT family NTPase